MLRLGLWRVVYDDDGLAFSVEVWANWDVGFLQEMDTLLRQGAAKILEGCAGVSRVPLPGLREW